MTTLQQVQFECPCCRRDFRSQDVVSTNSFGGKRTDFHERAAGTQPHPYLVHVCPHCGFAGPKQDFEGGGADISPDVRERIDEELTPRVQGAALTGSEKYELAALAAEWRELEDRHTADLWLRAAWCCVDEGDVEAERYYRLKAARKFEEALGKFDGVERTERATLTYLAGELWRRIGDQAKAAAWFDRVPGEIEDPQAQQWVADAARQQRNCPREWFG
jgi:uncharacterized protein (DUF2225 family)